MNLREARVMEYRDERNQWRIKLFARQTWLNIPISSAPLLLSPSPFPLSRIHNATHQANARDRYRVPKAGNCCYRRLITLQISYLNLTASHSVDPLVQSPPRSDRTNAAIMFVRSM